MLIDFCIREVHKRMSNPDVFMGRWSLVERHLNDVLQAGLQLNMTRTLEGMGHSVKWTQTQDGTLIANVGPVDGVGPSHRINVPARFYAAGDLSRRKLGVRKRGTVGQLTMPRKSLAARTQYQKEYRARIRAAKKPHLPGMEPGPALPSDVAGAIEQFCREKLIVPPGHPLAGNPMELEPFALAFLRDVFQPKITEGLLCCARKQGKVRWSEIPCSPSYPTADLCGSGASGLVF